MDETMPRLFTALAEWGGCMLYLSQYPRRLSGRRFWLAALLALLVQGLWLELTGSLAVAFWMPAMAAAVGLMFCFLYFCGRTSLVWAGYCTVRAFLLAEFAASLEWQLYAFFVYQTRLDSPLLSGLFLVAVYGGVFFLVFRLERKVSDGKPLPSLTLRELASAAAMGLSAFFISNLSFVSANTPFSSSFRQEIFNIRTLVDLAGVVILYAYHMQLYELHARRELAAIQNILQNQYVQYRHYEAQNKTGNSVLDTVLTGKSLYCAKHQIKLTCVVDGSRLAFMDIMDICTLFGNALDNAIECEISIPGKEKRLIHLEVYAKKNFLVIQCENYCSNPPTFENGLPVTTKADREYHGYGLKRMRYTAQRYGGTMSVQVREDWFQLTLLFPLTQP